MPMPDKKIFNQKDDSTKIKKLDYLSRVMSIAALGLSVFSYLQLDRLSSAAALLQHTQHRISNCIAISQHHYAMWQRDEAINWQEKISLIIDGKTVDDRGQQFFVTGNYERANKAIGLARQLALCTSSDSNETRKCVNGSVEKSPDWLVNDDKVEQGDQPRKGSRNWIC